MKWYQLRLSTLILLVVIACQQAAIIGLLVESRRQYNESMRIMRREAEFLAHPKTPEELRRLTMPPGTDDPN